METKDKSILKKRETHKEVILGKGEPAWGQELDHRLGAGRFPVPEAVLTEPWKKACLLFRYLAHNRW